MANARSDAVELSVSDRVLLFCLASGTEWKRVVTQSAVTRLIVHGVIDRAAAGRLELLPTPLILYPSATPMPVIRR